MGGYLILLHLKKKLLFAKENYFILLCLIPLFYFTSSRYFDIIFFVKWKM